MCDAIHLLLDNICIKKIGSQLYRRVLGIPILINCAPFVSDLFVLYYGSKLYRRVLGIPILINCAPFVTDLFVLYYERDFMLSLSVNNQADVIEAVNSTA